MEDERWEDYLTLSDICDLPLASLFGVPAPPLITSTVNQRFPQVHVSQPLISNNGFSNIFQNKVHLNKEDGLFKKASDHDPFEIALKYLDFARTHNKFFLSQYFFLNKTEEWFKKAYDRDPFEIALIYLDFAKIGEGYFEGRSYVLNKANEWFKKARGHAPYEIALKYLEFAKTKEGSLEEQVQALNIADGWFKIGTSLNPYEVALKYLEFAKAKKGDFRGHCQALSIADRWFKKARGLDPYEVALKYLDVAKTKEGSFQGQLQALNMADGWFKKARGHEPYEIALKYLDVAETKKGFIEGQLQALNIADGWFKISTSLNPYEVALKYLEFAETKERSFEEQSLVLNIADGWFKKARGHKPYEIALKYLEFARTKERRCDGKSSLALNKADGWFKITTDYTPYMIALEFLKISLEKDREFKNQVYIKIDEWCKKVSDRGPYDSALSFFTFAKSELFIVGGKSQAIHLADEWFGEFCYNRGLACLDGIINIRTKPLECLRAMDLAKKFLRNCKEYPYNDIYGIGLKYSQICQVYGNDFRIYNKAFSQAHKWWQRLKPFPCESSLCFNIGQAYLQMARPSQLYKPKRLRAMDEANIWLNRITEGDFDFYQMILMYMSVAESIAFPSVKLEDQWGSLYKWVPLINKISQPMDLSHFTTIAYQLGRHYALGAPHSKMGLYWLYQAETWSGKSTQKVSSEDIIKGWQEQAREEEELNYLISLFHEVKKGQGTLEEEKSLREEKIIDALKYKDRLIHGKIASPFTLNVPFEVVVIGGGLSGVLSAIQLAKLKDNYDRPLLKVTLLEEKTSLMGGASAIPARLHCGGEYPLDKITALDCLHSSLLFLQMIPHGYTDVPAVTYLVHKQTQQEYKAASEKLKKLEERYRAVYEKSKGLSGKRAPFKRKAQSARFFYQTGFPYTLHDIHKKKLKLIQQEIESLKLKMRNLLSVKKVTKRYKRLQSYYERYYKHLNNGITSENGNLLFGLPDQFYRELNPSELNHLGLNDFSGGIVTHEKGLNPAILAAYLMKQLKEADVEVIYQSKVTRIEQKSYGYELYSNSKGYRADIVVNATFENAEKLENKVFPEAYSPFQEEKLNVFLRGMLALDISNCKDLPRVRKISLDELKLNEKGKEKADQGPLSYEETAYFGLLGENGGMFSFFNKHLAWGFWPHENGSYIRWDNPDKQSILSFKISGDKEKDKQQWQSLKAKEQYLLDNHDERLKRAQAIFDNLKKKYPCMEKAIVKDLIVRRIISPSKQSQRQHNMVKCLGREQDWIQAVSLKATFAPMTSLQVVRSVLEYMVDKGMGERVWHTKVYVAEQWLKNVYYWMENWQTPPDEVYNGINLPEQFRLPAVTSEQEVELCKQAEKWIATHSLPTELLGIQRMS